jgi:hypothetical protein
VAQQILGHQKVETTLRYMATTDRRVTGAIGTRSVAKDLTEAD